MANLFYTLFKYKEKAQKDELGYYPEKVDVKAFPERRYLWTSRFFAVISCLSMCVSMILAGALCLLIPMKKVRILPMQIDYERYQVIPMSASESRAYSGDLVTESLMSEYITKRYTIGDSYDEMSKRFGENDFVYLASDKQVYGEFQQTEQPYFETLQKKGVRREVKINMIYPVSMDFWQVRFDTVDKIPGEDTPLISHWIATLRMTFNFSKYDNKDLGLINPFGVTIVNYNLSYMGNNIKGKRE